MEELEECPVCKEKSVICDEENGQKVKVCTECGAMDADMQDLTHDKTSEGTTLTDGITRGPDALKYKSGLQTECGGLKSGRKMIRTLGPSLNFSRDMIDDAIKLYERAFPEDVKYLQEGRRYGMCIACLYVVSRINNFRIEMRSLLKFLNTNHPYKKFSQALNILKSKYGIVLPRSSFSDDCHNLLKERSFKLEEIRLVQQLLPLLQRSWISEGRLSRSFIHVAAYFAWKAKDYPNRRKTSYRKFSSDFGLVKCNDRKKEIEDLLKAMIKELPWINEKEEKIDVSLHLSDVVKYQHLLFDSALQTTLANLKQDELEIKKEPLEFDVHTIEEHESAFVKLRKKRTSDEPSDDLVDLESLPKRSKITHRPDKNISAADDNDDLDLGSDDDTSQYIRTEAEVKEIEALYESSQSD